MPIGMTGATGSRRRALWIAAAGVVLLLALACFYRRFLLSGLDLVAEGTGSRTSAALCLAAALLILALLLVWLLFPLFVYFGLRDLSRRTAELDRTMKLCAQQLSRTPAPPSAAKVEEPPGPQGPGAGG